MANMGAGLKKPIFDLATLPKFEKNFYREADSVKSRSEREIEDFRHKKTIRVQGKHIPHPVETFDEAGFPSNLPPPIPFVLLNQV
jgi:ATP-dependent RNA helicase DDX5/DBP2